MVEIPPNWGWFWGISVYGSFVGLPQNYQNVMITLASTIIITITIIIIHLYISIYIYYYYSYYYHYYHHYYYRFIHLYRSKNTWDLNPAPQGLVFGSGFGCHQTGAHLDVHLFHLRRWLLRLGASSSSSQYIMLLLTITVIHIHIHIHIYIYMVIHGNTW